MNQTPSPELQAVKIQLAAKNAHENELAKIDAAIAAQHQIIAGAVVDRSPVDQLQHRLEDALAQFATGQTPSEPPDMLASQLKKAQVDFDKADAGATITADNARRVIAGLTRRQETLQAMTGTQGHELNAALKAFVISEQDQAGRDYVRAADDLISAYARIQGLQRFAHARQGISRDGPQPFACELELLRRPQNMPCGEGIAHSPGNLEWMFDHGNLRKLVDTAYHRVIADFQQQGAVF